MANGQRVGYIRVSSIDQNTERQLEGLQLDRCFTDKASGNDLRILVLTLTKRGIQVQFVKESLTFSGEDSPMAMLLLSMLGAVAEFERSMIRERQREGIAIAKAKGSVYKGRKPSLTPDRVAELRSRAADGEKKAGLAREFKISRETLYQYIRGAAI
jgi:DNA invertase Pin-like site-specific DNA recombinase